MGVGQAMGAHMNDLIRELSSPSRGRDALLRLVSKGRIARLLEHLDSHPANWELVETYAGAVLEALIERRDLDPDAPEVVMLISRLNPDRLYTKAKEIADRGQLGWALLIVTTVLKDHPQADAQWWWLRAQIEAGRKQTDQEYSALLEVLSRHPEPALESTVARRLIEIGFWQDGFVVLRKLYVLPAWRGSVIQLLASLVLTDNGWSEPDQYPKWDRYWAESFDDLARVQLWGQMLEIGSQQVAYDRDALADGIEAMQSCLKSIGGRDLEADSEQAQLGHALALKLMRFVNSLEPIELSEQPIYMMLLDMLVAWEIRWKERGVTLAYSMEKDLGSVWVDERVFVPAMEILWEQFASQLVPGSRASLGTNRDAMGQAVEIVLEPCDPLRCIPPQPLSAIDAAFVERVMRGHGYHWDYGGDGNRTLSVSISTTAPSPSQEVAREEQGREWLTRWQVRGQDGLSSLSQQDSMICEPFVWGMRLVQGLKNGLIADWAEQIRVIVHDLKNLFTFMQQWINQALTDPYSWTMAMERVAEIKARMQETLMAVRELAVLSGPPECEPVAVVELVRRVISNSRAFLEAHSVSCSIDQKTGRGEIWADPKRLISAITNLLKNGVEAMPEGGQITVTIDQTDPGSVRLAMADTGVGIEAEDLPSLFALGRSNKPGGSGVGLAAVARTLTSMGAAITVDSSPGLGSRFIIVFPQRSAHPTGHGGLLPLPKEQQPRMTQQALRAASALHAAGDHRMTVHLWYKALIGQVEPPLRRTLPPVRVRQLLANVTQATKRGSQQLNDNHRARLQSALGCPIKQLVKKSDTVIQALISGAWERLTHPLHWAILLQLFTGQDVYPWPGELCSQMARWLVRADMVDEMEVLDIDRVADLGAELSTLLELALEGHLGA